MVTFFNIYWIQPLLPLLQQDFAITPLAANLAIAAAMLGMGLGLLIFASWSDAIGRCKILLLGTAAGVCVTLLLPFVHDYNLFIGMRFVQGALLAVCPAVAIPLFGDELRRNWLPSAVGVYVACNSLGGISGRLISGISAEFGGHWQAACLAIGLLSSVMFAVVIYALPEQKRFKPKAFRLSESLKAYGRHLKRPELVLVYLIIGLVFGSFVNQFSYLMLVLGDLPYELPSSVRSLLFVTFFGGTLSASMAGKYAKKHGQLAGIATGLLIMLGANFFLQAGHLSLMIIGLIATAVGFFFCHAQASTFVGRSVKEAKGSAQALYSLFYYSGASFGAFYLEPFFQHWGWSGVVVGTSSALMLCLVMVGILWRYFDNEHHVPPVAA